MLFNSYQFIFLFLPVAVLVYYALNRVSLTAANTWLLAASVTFYGWWDVRYVPLLLGSILANYLFGLALARAPRWRRWMLAGAVSANLLLLGYYKYANFFVDSINNVLGTGWPLPNLILPLGISFFTFTQIAFLVDVARGESSEPDLIRYGVFVSYFPHLIAGPVLHHKEIIGQLVQRRRPEGELVCAGLLLFAIGLAKKVLIADGLAPHADAAFGAARDLDAVSAWIGILAFALQIYFDFSGYSDMAIGMSFMLGIALPINFNSPYKAASIIEFWRRWHMTLSAYLRDYLYFPLGGNRKGTPRRYLNLITTMLLGGLWHGAAWTFVLWGGLHGLYLVLNHAWRALGARAAALAAWSESRPGRGASIALTFLATCLAWVLFRAASLDSALQVLGGALGRHGSGLEALARSTQALLGQMIAASAEQAWPGRLLQALSLGWGQAGAVIFIAAGLTLAWLAPNSQQIVAYAYRRAPGLGTAQFALAWRPSLAGALAAGLLFAAACFEMMVVPATKFLYFNF